MSILLILFLIQAFLVQEVGHSSIHDDTDQENDRSVGKHFTWGKYFPPFNVSFTDLVMKIPEVKFGINWHLLGINSFLDYLLILLCVVNFGTVLNCFPNFRKGQTSKGFAGALERTLEKPVSGWQGIWEQFGKLVGRVAPPIYWDFTPELVLDPDKMAHYLLEGCFLEEDPNMRFFALYWGLASAYRAAVDHFRKVMVEAGTQTEMENTLVESGTQTETMDSIEIATQTTPPEIESTPPMVQTVLSAIRAMLPEIPPTPPVTQTVSTATQTMPLEAQPTPPVAQTVLPAAQITLPEVCPTPPVIQTVSSVTQSVPPETQSAIPEDEDMTEKETHTAKPNISIAPVTKKKRWVREAAEYPGPVPRLQRMEEEEEEGAYGPIPSETVKMDERRATKDEEAAVRLGARPKRLIRGAAEYTGPVSRLQRTEEEEEEGAYGPILSDTVRADEKKAAIDEEVAARLGARLKELRARPKEEGAPMASKPPVAIRPPKRIVTPEYSLLDCTSEELEEYLKSQAASTSQAESYTLPPPREPREQRRSPSPQRSQPLPPRERSRERRRSPSPQRFQPLPPRGRSRERHSSPTLLHSQPLPPRERSREQRRSPSPQRSQFLPLRERSREQRRSPSTQRSQPLPPRERSREQRRSPSTQRSQPLPQRERSREGLVLRREVPRRDLRDPYYGAEVLRESEVLRTLKPAELRDLRKDFSRRPGERILTWLVRCWDTGAKSHMLEGHEARQLGSLARDHEIELEIARETYTHSLWYRILHGVRERYPFKEFLTGPQRKWTTAEEGVQYLRELAMLELVYADSDYYDILEPDKIPCTSPMWRKIVRGAPASYVHCLITVYHPQIEEPTVDTMCSWIRLVAEDLEHSSDVQHQPTYGRQRNRPVQRSQPRFRPRSQSQSRSRSPSMKPRRRGNPGRKSRSQLWSYLRSKGENMKKWDGEPTSKLEARVKELKQKEGNKKFVHVVNAEIQSLRKELQSLRHKKTDDKKDSKKSKQTSDDECSDHSQ